MISKQFYDGDDRTKQPRKPRPNSQWERQRAVQTVAALAVDAVDCALLLDMLGLTPAEGLDGGPSLRASGSTTRPGSAA